MNSRFTLAQVTRWKEWTCRNEVFLSRVEEKSKVSNLLVLFLNDLGVIKVVDR